MTVVCQIIVFRFISGRSRGKIDENKISEHFDNPLTEQSVTVKYLKLTRGNNCQRHSSSSSV